MPGDSLWEGLQQVQRAEPGLWEGLMPQQQIVDRMAWRMIPPSQNVDDRRGQGLTLADIVQKAMMWMTDDRPTPMSARNPNVPSAAYGDDISSAMDQIKFGTALRNMGRHADANAANEAWLQSIEKPR